MTNRMGWRRGLGLALVGLVVLGVAILVQLRGSLPVLDGAVEVRGLNGRVVVERDAQGVPTLSARRDEDLYFGLGWCHAQDRFFQMDLLRRRAAGELAELFGTLAREVDRETRVHQFRARAAEVLGQVTPAERRVLQAYTKGVNEGLQSLRCLPLEYTLLRCRPDPWSEQDCLLVQYGMFLTLQADEFDRELSMGVLHAEAQPIFDFLTYPTSEFDAPIDGTVLTPPNMPTAQQYNVRQTGLASFAQPLPLTWEAPAVGSNQWAVSGAETKTHAALVSNDMHLPLRLPNIWYRASLKFANQGNRPAIQATGVTIPGAPALVAGSNGHVAWGFTNSRGDWSDLIVLEPNAERPQQYMTPDGPEPFEVVQETIRVRDADDDVLTIQKTQWGPVIGQDYQGRKLALRWAAHDAEAVNLKLMFMATLTELKQGLTLANQCGCPQLNLVIGDAQGKIAWTLCGRVPRRSSYEARVPQSWADGRCRWDGYLQADEYPRVVRETGQLWTANARVVGGDSLSKLGLGGYDRGARAKQIRDLIQQKIDSGKVTEKDLLEVHLDDRAIFLQRWRQLMLQQLEASPHPSDLWRQAASHVRNWGQRASVDAVGYRLVDEFRREVSRRVVSGVVAPCRAADPDFTLRLFPELERPVWRMVAQQPLHLLDPKYHDWSELLNESIEEVLARTKGDVSGYTWGAANVARIEHPLSRGVSWLRGFLNLEPMPLPGAKSDMPRIQGPSFGASQRFTVSPGREAEGYFHMPGGQSGHPASPFYRQGHAAWAFGLPTPFLPGAPVHRLELRPKLRR